MLGFLVCAVICGSAQNATSPILSRLTMRQSSLASMSFLYQGFPDSVFDSEFVYSDPLKQSYEDFLAKLFDRPTKAQMQLRESAQFLGSRLYVDERNRPYLVIGREDATWNFGMLRLDASGSYTKQDKLLSNALRTYFLLKLNRAQAFEHWPVTNDKASECVRSNVKAIVAKIVISDRIDDKWKYTFPVR